MENCLIFPCSGSPTQLCCSAKIVPLQFILLSPSQNISIPSYSPDSKHLLCTWTNTCPNTLEMLWIWTSKNIARNAYIMGRREKQIKNSIPSFQPINNHSSSIEQAWPVKFTGNWMISSRHCCSPSFAASHNPADQPRRISNRFHPNPPYLPRSTIKSTPPHWATNIILPGIARFPPAMLATWSVPS